MPIDTLDHGGLLYARTHGHTPAAERAVAGFSKLAEHGSGWIAVGLAGALLDPYLGVHYPSDVLAGAALGTAVAQVRGR